MTKTEEQDIGMVKRGSCGGWVAYKEWRKNIQEGFSPAVRGTEGKRDCPVYVGWMRWKKTRGYLGVRRWR